MSSVQIADQTFIAAPPAVAAALIADPAKWRQWWPDLRLSVAQARGEQGIRWGVAGPLSGTMEIWLEPVLDGALLHYFLHAEPARAVPEAKLAAARRARRVAGVSMAFEVKRAAEGARAAGSPAAQPVHSDVAAGLEVVPIAQGSGHG